MPAGIHFINLRDETPARRTALAGTFYHQVYRDAFPKPDQAETPDVWLPLLGEEVPDDQPRIYIVLACEGVERILGGVIFEHYRASGCWLATYLVVRSDAQRRGVAAGLMSEVARISGHSQAQDVILLAETENPARIADPAERANAEQRLRILDRLGMRALPVEYIQPALAPGKDALDDLLLLCFAPSDAAAGVPAARIAAFLAEFYAALYQADAPYLARIAAALAQQDILVARRLSP